MDGVTRPECLVMRIIKNSLTQPERVDCRWHWFGTNPWVPQLACTEQQTTVHGCSEEPAGDWKTCLAPEINPTKCHRKITSTVKTVTVNMGAPQAMSIHSGRVSQQSWSRRTIPNKHGRRRYCSCWLEQNDVTRPACCLHHVHWGRSASLSTASNASAVVTGRKNSREYLI